MFRKKFGLYNARDYIKTNVINSLYMTKIMNIE